jgi:hypothetical protein
LGTVTSAYLARWYALLYPGFLGLERRYFIPFSNLIISYSMDSTAMGITSNSFDVIYLWPR